MKRMFTIIGLSLLMAATTFAQKPMDQQSEKNVQITQGPNITGITGTTATINWTTNSPGANHVRYRVAGSNSGWKSAYASGGGTSHSLQLTGLEPGRVYEWQILTRDGDLRTAGQFQSAATAAGTAPDVNGGGAAAGASGGGSSTPAGAKVPLYRAVSTSTGGHLYTTNGAEQSSQAWKPEGITGYVMSSQGDGTTALYRLVNAKGDYVLTTDGNSRAALLGQGYRDEGVIGYVAMSPVAGTQPLFGLSDGISHFYTTSAGERDSVASRGYQSQGINGYIWTQQ